MIRGILAWVELSAFQKGVALQAPSYCCTGGDIMGGRPTEKTLGEVTSWLWQKRHQ